ncbi:MAG: ATP-binding cassette domain-containing protein [Crenarchaeota archaeon]|nr:ATP-binding cassette domain-containing protein [Thermoproteota archaeon]
MIVLEDVSVIIGGDKIIDSISLKFDRKTFLLGPNGAGKTTLFRTILGMTKYRGRITIEGKDLDAIYGDKHLVTTNLQEVYQLLPLTCYDLASLYMDLFDGSLDDALQMLSQFDLTKDFLKKRELYQLSAGQQKIFTTVLALAIPAKNKLLDEPFEQLDPAKKKILVDLIQKDPATVILSTHELWSIKEFNPNDWDIAFMFEGKISGKVAMSEITGSYFYLGEHPNAKVTIKTKAGTISIVKEPTNYPLENVLSLDLIYKML